MLTLMAFQVWCKTICPTWPKTVHPNEVALGHPIIRMISFDLTQAASRWLGFHLQYYGGIHTRLTEMNYDYILAQLRVATALDAQSKAPYWLAAYIYSWRKNKVKELVPFIIDGQNHLYAEDWDYALRIYYLYREDLHDLKEALRWAEKTASLAYAHNGPEWAKDLPAIVSLRAGQKMVALAYLKKRLEETNDERERIYLEEKIKELSD